MFQWETVNVDTKQYVTYHK